MNNFFKKNLYLFLIIFCTLFCTSCVNHKIMQYRSYGIDYLENQNYEEALKYFNEAIKVGNGEVGKIQYDILLYKAECLFMLQRYDEAKKIYETLLSIDKNNKTYKELNDNISSINKLVDFKTALDDFDVERAEKILFELKELGMEHEKSVMFNQAVLYERKAEWKNALNSFNYFLKQYPGDKDAEHEIEFIEAQLNSDKLYIKETKKNDD